MTAKKSTANTKKTTAKKVTVKATSAATETTLAETTITDAIEGIEKYEVAPDTFDLSDAPKEIVDAVMEAIPQEEDAMVSEAVANETLESLPQDVKEKFADAKTDGVKKDAVNDSHNNFYKRNIGFAWNGVEMDW